MDNVLSRSMNQAIQQWLVLTIGFLLYGNSVAQAIEMRPEQPQDSSTLRPIIAKEDVTIPDSLRYAYDRLASVSNVPLINTMLYDESDEESRALHDSENSDFGCSQEDKRFMSPIWDHPQAALIFQKLFHEKNPYSKLYALTGLYFTDRTYYGLALQQMRHTYGLDLSSEACIQRPENSIIQLYLTFFQETKDTPPKLPQAMWEATQTPIHRIKEYLRNGGHINDQWSQSVNSRKDTLLSFAARNGDVQAVNYLLLLGADVHPDKNFGMTPLMMHAALGDVRQLESVAQGKISIDEIDDNGETALFWAIRSEQSDTALWLIQHGAKQDIQNRRGLKARNVGPHCSDFLLHLDVLLGRTFRTGMLSVGTTSSPKIKGTPGEILPSSEGGQKTPATQDSLSKELAFAIVQVDVAAVRHLLGSGASLPQSKEQNCLWSLLPHDFGIAMSPAQLDIAEMLFEHGISPDFSEPKEKRAPLDAVRSIWRKMRHVVTLGARLPEMEDVCFEQNSYGGILVPFSNESEVRTSYPERGKLLLWQAVVNNRERLVLESLNHGVRLNYTTDQDFRILLDAVEGENLAIARLLLQRYHTRALTRDQKKILYFAAMMAGHSSFATRFLTQRQSKDLIPPDELLLTEITAGHTQHVQKLLLMNANPNATSAITLRSEAKDATWSLWNQDENQAPRGDSALCAAIGVGSIQMVEMLLERGAGPNKISPGIEYPPLGCLFLDSPYLENKKKSSYSWQQMATLLLRAGAEPNPVNASGIPLLTFLAYSPSYESIEALLQLGADVTRTTPNGKTALQVVRESNDYSKTLCRQSIERLLLKYATDSDNKK